MAQVVVRLPETLMAAVDELVEKGIVESRSDAVRRSLEELVDRERRAEIGRLIVEGYTRFPPGELDAWDAASAQDMVEEEPW